MSDMGTFRTSIEIESTQTRGHIATVTHALVDTGSELTWVPEAVLRSLGIVVEDTLRFVTATGEQIEREVGIAIVHAAGTKAPDYVVFAKPGDMTVLGARSLEGMNLRVDALRKQLIPAGPILAGAMLRTTLMMNVLRSGSVVLLGAIISCTDPLPPQSVQRAIFDNSISNALIRTTTDLVRQYIAGATRGSVNLNVNCRNGGSAAISGTITAAETGVVTRDLKFVLNQCLTVDSVVYSYGTSVRSLRVTGTLMRVADFGSAFIRAGYQSIGPLDVNGTLHLVINSRTSLDPLINESCAFTADDEPARTAGSYCSRAFSY